MAGNVSEIEAIFIKAEQLRESGKTEEALTEYTRVVYFAPRHWPAYFHLGVIFGEKGHLELAVSLLSRSQELNPKNHVIKNHLAGYLMQLDRNEEAMLLLKESWELDPSYANISAPAQVGKIYWESNRPVEAISYFDIVLEDWSGREGEIDEVAQKKNIDLRHVSRWLRGVAKMSLGQYLEAWPDYEARNNVPGVIVPELSGELWTGQNLKDKTIFFAFEQRFGDVLQFVRFLPLLVEQGARILVQTPIQLDRQLRHSYPDIELVSTEDPIPDYDYYHYITSIPPVLNMTYEDIGKGNKPYLGVTEADKQSIPARNETTLKVGFTWAGQPDPDRSIPLKYYIPLLKHRSVSFYSFQLGDRRNDMVESAVGWLVHDLSPSISDFYDSSLLLEEMDLLITIDTAIAHQAGGLGLPVWVMLLYFSDWRWQLDRDDCMWYPTMRLFRQHRQGDWSQAARQLEEAFDEWVAHSLKAKGIAA